ncbi:MAG: hypothetical protein ACXACF_04880 [Candidatus Hermodarchaeia archaeon]
MSDNIQAWVNYMQQVDSTIMAVSVIRSDGTVMFTTPNWTITGAEILSAVQSKPPSITIQGVKYSTIQATDHHLVATNVRGQQRICNRLRFSSRRCARRLCRNCQSVS